MMRLLLRLRRWLRGGRHEGKDGEASSEVWQHEFHGHFSGKLSRGFVVLFVRFSCGVVVVDCEVCKLWMWVLFV